MQSAGVTAHFLHGISFIFSSRIDCFKSTCLKVKKERHYIPSHFSSKWSIDPLNTPLKPLGSQALGNLKEKNQMDVLSFIDTMEEAHTSLQVGFLLGRTCAPH